MDGTSQSDNKRKPPEYEHQQTVVNAIERRNAYQLQYVLSDLKVDRDVKLDYLENLSIFEKVLATPESGNLIKICLQTGSSFFKRNADDIYPLDYAVKSLCANNLQAILKQEFLNDLKFLTIINTKLAGGDNYLHFLAKELLDKNQKRDEIGKMIEIIVDYGCSPNTFNDHDELPLYLLLKPYREFNMRVIDFLAFRVDVSTADDFTFDFMRRRAGIEESFVRKTTKDLEYMKNLVMEFNEGKFIEEFKDFEKNSKNLNKDILVLALCAARRDAADVMRFLLDKGADVNKDKLAFITCAYGFRRSLKVILNRSKDLKFFNKKLKRNLLHEILLTHRVEMQDRSECFKMLISDRRCDRSIINGKDEFGYTPLNHACELGSQTIVKDLLKRGASVGRDCVGKINKKVVEEFLDDSLRILNNDQIEQNSRVRIDFRFLMSPEPGGSETESANVILSNAKLKSVLQHPVVSSFLHLKWKKVDKILYPMLVIYLYFMIFFVSYILSATEKNYFIHKSPRYKISVTGFVLIAYYELKQFLYHPREFFLKAHSWIVIIFFYLSSVILFDTTKFKRADFEFIQSFLIVVIAIKLVRLIEVLYLCLSLNIKFLRKCCWIFLKITALVPIFIIASFTFGIFSGVIEIASNTEKIVQNGTSTFKENLTIFIVTVLAYIFIISLIFRLVNDILHEKRFNFRDPKPIIRENQIYILNQCERFFTKNLFCPYEFKITKIFPTINAIAVDLKGNRTFWKRKRGEETLVLKEIRQTRCFCCRGMILRASEELVREITNIEKRKKEEALTDRTTADYKSSSECVLDLAKFYRERYKNGPKV